MADGKLTAGQLACAKAAYEAWRHSLHQDGTYDLPWEFLSCHVRNVWLRVAAAAVFKAREVGE